VTIAGARPSSPGAAGALQPTLRGALSPSSVRLFLIRHGETASNRELRYVGARDEPLAASGRAQADSLAAVLAELPLAAIYASPLCRAGETARPIAARLGLAPAPEPRLSEQCFGDWEGLTRAEVVERGDGERERLLRWESDAGHAPPGGESLEQVRQRAVACAGDLLAAHRGEWIALVSHVGPIKSLLCTALGAPLATARRMFLDPGTLSVVDWGDPPVVRLFNAHAHLGWSQARWMQPPPAAPRREG
jgi:broad specificity phosphatase PhoE